MLSSADSVFLVQNARLACCTICLVFGQVLVLLSAGVLTTWQAADVSFQQLLLECCATDDDAADGDVWWRRHQQELLCQALAELAATAASPVQDAAAALEDHLSSLSTLREESGKTAAEEADGAAAISTTDRPATSFKVGLQLWTLLG